VKTQLMEKLGYKFYNANEVIYNVKRHQLINERLKTLRLHWGRTYNWFHYF